MQEASFWLLVELSKSSSFAVQAAFVSTTLAKTQQLAALS
jgi:hypothetical protein